MSRQSLRALVCAFASVVAGAFVMTAPAAAYWQAGGSGTGSGSVGTLAAGTQPTASGSAQTLTVTWTQTWFGGNLLGTLGQGGYVVRRYPAAGGSAVTPGTACDTTITGSATSLSCQETNVPVGSWRYTVATVLGSWTGAEGAQSAAVQSAPSAPVLSSASAQDPPAGPTTGAITLAWANAAGATGYNVYRRTGSGSYDFSAPLNGAIPLFSTTYTDPGTGLTGGVSYSYVVRGVASSIESASSNERSATAIARPGAPGSITATLRPAAQVQVGWASVSGATGYNVYRRASSGSFDYSAALNGSTPVTAVSYTDTTSVNATTYRYVARAVGPGATSAGVEGASSAETTDVTADSTTPTGVSLTAPASLLRGTVSLSGTASDTGSGISLARFQLAPAGTTTWTDGCTSTSAPFTCSLMTNAFADGLYDLRVLASDGAGNATASATVTGRRIDNTAPAATMSDPGAYVRGTRTLTATASDGGSGVTSLRIESAPTGTSTWTTICTVATGSASCPWNTTALAAGGYDLRAVAGDAAGNTGTAFVANRIVDNTAPTATDIQTTNKTGGTAGKTEAGDVVTYTFSEPMAPASILAGWSGASTSVTVRVVSGSPDTASVYNAANTTQLALGSVTAGSTGFLPTTTFSGSTMVLSGNTIVVTLGTASGATPTAPQASTLQWTVSTAATDRAGNPLTAGTRAETGALDFDF